MSTVAKEVAESEFDRMCTARRLDIDESTMDDEDKAKFAELKKPIIRAIMGGHVIVSEAGDPTFTPPVAGGKPLTFHRPTGATFMAMDSKDGKYKGQLTAMASAITEMTRTTPGDVSKLEAPDFQLCCSLANLFLASR
jgi:hypothetical protein